MNWIEIAAIKSFKEGKLLKRSASTDGRLFKNKTSCAQHITVWREEGTSFSDPKIAL